MGRRADRQHSRKGKEEEEGEEEEKCKEVAVTSQEIEMTCRVTSTTSCRSDHTHI